MKIEMLDQCARHQSGGAMGQVLMKEHLENEAFVYQRIGWEGRTIRENILKSRRKNKNKQSIEVPKPSMKRRMKDAILNLIIKDWPFKRQALEVGLFRLGGEVHQWMYDRYSLKLLLKDLRFIEITQKKAEESEIESFSSFGLEKMNGDIRKPDSLFMEAKKPSF